MDDTEDIETLFYSYLDLTCLILDLTRKATPDRLQISREEFQAEAIRRFEEHGQRMREEWRPYAERVKEGTKSLQEIVKWCVSCFQPPPSTPALEIRRQEYWSLYHRITELSEEIQLSGIDKMVVDLDGFLGHLDTLYKEQTARLRDANYVLGLQTEEELDREIVRLRGIIDFHRRHMQPAAGKFSAN